MKKISVIRLFLMLFLLGNSSCKKWLGAQSDSDLFVSQALSERSGFSKALSGIYSQLGNASLYGREMEFGFMDVLTGYWQMNVQHLYYQDYNFNYQDNNVQQRIAAIWSGLYKTIRQCNIILAHIEAIKNDPYYDLIKGETLGLRAYLHLELLKLFGPVISQHGLDTPAIPYYDNDDRKLRPALTSRACLARIEADLQAAKVCLQQDPIISLGRTGNGNTLGAEYNTLIDRRGIHLNYYAVLALLARKSLWERNFTEAGQRAKDAIAQLEVSQAVRFVRPEDWLQNGELIDLRFSPENILGLYINQIQTLTRGYLSQPYTLDQILVPEYKQFLDKLYTSGTGSTDDLRFQLWRMDVNILKFNITPVGDNSHEVQLINLPELYFIAAESQLDSNLEQALHYLNVVRANRQLPAISYNDALNRAQVSEMLLDEVRREYIGEGYLFSYYKHLNHPIYRISESVMPSEQVFVFPKPLEESIFYNPS